MIRQLAVGLGGVALCGAGMTAFAFGASLLVFPAALGAVVAGAGVMTWAVGLR